MSDNTKNFELPKNIERFLAALSKLYGREGKRNLQEIVVNAQVRVQEQWSSDNWNGGTYGHALYLTVPEAIFLANVSEKDGIQKQISADLNKVHNVQNEFIEEVFLEMELGADQDWRKDSGLLVVGRREVTAVATKRIWEDDGFRIFLSHRAEVKKETASLKTQLSLFGITSFVAHEDIHPTREWQDEIENALTTMDGLVALMTDNFHESDWTDQEVGFGVARAVPIVAVQLGRLPYGFLAKYQGLASKWETAATDIVGVLLKQERMFASYVQALRRCPSWSAGNTLGAPLPELESLSEKQIDLLVAAYNETSELRGSFAFNGSKPRFYGEGLVSHLNRLSDRTFEFSSEGMIKQVTRKKTQK